jgi:hypothetical protein
VVTRQAVGTIVDIAMITVDPIRAEVTGRSNTSHGTPTCALQEREFVTTPKKRRGRRGGAVR